MLDYVLKLMNFVFKMVKFVLTNDRYVRQVHEYNAGHRARWVGRMDGQRWRHLRALFTRNDDFVRKMMFLYWQNDNFVQKMMKFY